MSESLSQKYERILAMCDPSGKRHGAYAQIRCPIKSAHKHEDRERSASLGLHSNGISFKCFAGCQTDDFLKELGLTYKDLFPDDERIPTNIYTYHNADGSYHHDKLKYRNPDGKKTFSQRTIDENGKVSWTSSVGIPFAYPQLIEAINQSKLVLYCEGEKDVMTAKVLGYEATTMGGASDWKDEFKNFFKDASLILIPDKDDAGLKLTNKMVESLKPVVKSLRTMILPVGKDLTEWVEAGNYDLKSLIDKTSVELTTTNGIPEPVMKVIVGGYEFYWIGLNLKITIDHISDEDAAEIVVYQNDKPLYISGLNLLSISHKQSLVSALRAVDSNIQWATIVNQVALKSLDKIRNGDEVIWLSSEHEVEQPEFLVAPLFVKNNPNIIYGDRSSAKSLFMMLIDIAVSIGFSNNPYGLSIPDAQRILFLDWENDINTTGWIKQCLMKGLYLDDLYIPYLHCSRPLVKSLPFIQQKINEVGATAIIIDSLGLAAGGNLNDSEPALNFFNALRQLPVTPLIIAHNAKDKENKFKTVYGNVFYENLSRSIWEVNKFQQMDSNELTISLYQRKAPPFSSYHPPIGLRFKFEGDRTFCESCQPFEDKRDSE